MTPHRHSLSTSHSEHKTEQVLIDHPEMAARERPKAPAAAGHEGPLVKRQQHSPGTDWLLCLCEEPICSWRVVLPLFHRALTASNSDQPWVPLICPCHELAMQAMQCRRTATLSWCAADQAAGSCTHRAIKRSEGQGADRRPADNLSM